MTSARITTVKAWNASWRRSTPRLTSTRRGRSSSTRPSAMLIQRLKVEETYKQHPEIDEAVIEGPVFIIGLPRTGTTALSQLVGADPQFRSLRMWESQAPTPPPEAATQHDDPRIAQAQAGLDMLHEMF